MTRTALLDADVLVYEAAKGNEHDIQWDDDLHTLHSEFTPAKLQLDRMVDRVMEQVGADRVVMALSDYTDPWRKRVMPTYKSNRKNVRKPLCFQRLRDYIHQEYTTFQRPGLEGDDVLGILLTHPKLVEGDKVCVSVDKDMKTLPGCHALMRNGAVTEEFEVGEWTADYYHMFQTLTGDTTDGYPGCPGVGPKRAEALLANEWGGESPWRVVVAAYEKAGLSAEVALQNARVARICRWTDYNYKEKEVILWNPPQ